MFELLKKYAEECGVTEAGLFAEKCVKFYDILIETNKTFNLTRITEPEEFASKHVYDSLAIFKYFPELINGQQRIADIGCGAGFPSLILAMAFPSLQLTPIDSIGKKAAFVERTAAELGLTNVKVVRGRSCELNCKQEFSHRFDIVTARAVAPAPIIYGDALNFPKRKGRFILYKTPDQAAEDVPALELFCRKHPAVWKTTEVFELPGNAGKRLFLYTE
jgi:16S rRNA (guanine527-N7)-methyltransferase